MTTQLRWRPEQEGRRGDPRPTSRRRVAIPPVNKEPAQRQCWRCRYIQDSDAVTRERPFENRPQSACRRSRPPHEEQEDTTACAGLNTLQGSKLSTRPAWLAGFGRGRHPWVAARLALFPARDHQFHLPAGGGGPCVRTPRQATSAMGEWRWSAETAVTSDYRTRSRHNWGYRSRLPYKTHDGYRNSSDRAQTHRTSGIPLANTEIVSASLRLDRSLPANYGSASSLLNTTWF
jgi:hypothetical protein